VRDFIKSSLQKPINLAAFSSLDMLQHCDNVGIAEYEDITSPVIRRVATSAYYTLSIINGSA